MLRSLILAVALAVTGCAMRGPSLDSMHARKSEIEFAFLQIDPELQARLDVRFGKAYPDGIAFQWSEVTGETDKIDELEEAGKPTWMSMSRHLREENGVVVSESIFLQCEDETGLVCLRMDTLDVVVLREGRGVKSHPGVGQSGTNWGNAHYTSLSITHAAVSSLLHQLNELWSHPSNNAGYQLSMAEVRWNAYRSLSDENGYIRYQDVTEASVLLEEYRNYLDGAEMSQEDQLRAMIIFTALVCSY